MKRIHLFVYVMLVATLVGCASTQSPTLIKQVAVSQEALQEAEEIGAREYAPLMVRNAEKKIEEAQIAMDSEKYTKAALLTEQAEVDAELAEAIARSEKAQAAVDEINDSIKNLKEEIARKRGN